MAYTVKEVARILRVCDRTVRNFVARGDLPAIRVGRRLLVPPGGVEEFCRLRAVIPTKRGGMGPSIPHVPMHGHVNTSIPQSYERTAT